MVGWQGRGVLVAAVVAAASFVLHAQVTPQGECALFASLPPSIRVWASHGDFVASAPPGFAVTATSATAPATPAIYGASSIAPAMHAGIAIAPALPLLPDEEGAEASR